jgi:hypothetical protein
MDRLSSLLFPVFLLFSLALLSCQSASNANQASSGSQPGGTQQEAPRIDVVTYHYDATRQGQDTQESILTLSNVNSNTFGKLALLPGDGPMSAQPLYVNALQIANQTHNVVYAVTENDSIYAYDADSFQHLWKATALAPNEIAGLDPICSSKPQLGITDTPVIDRQRGPHGAIYFVAMSQDANGGFHQRLHALDLTTGSELFSGPTEITATYPGTGDNSQNGQVVFDPGQYRLRVALLELNGQIYITFTSHCDTRPYTGWVMAYSATTLQQTSVLNLTPNGSQGAVWMSGGGLAADSKGYIYLLDGNGTFDTTLDSKGFPINGNYGNGALKIATSPQLAVADYFATYDTVARSEADIELGSGGALLLPDLRDSAGTVHQLLLAAGKDTHIYVLDRNNMGKFNSTNNAIYQDLDAALPGGMWGNAAYFNNTVYYCPIYGNLQAFKISNAQLSATPSSQTAVEFTYPGATPTVSANGVANAIVWAFEYTTPGVLHAYDATNLANELYNSNQAGARDQFGLPSPFMPPVVANGKVFVGTGDGVVVFGLLTK